MASSDSSTEVEQEPDRWYVLYCSDDDSHCLVDDIAIQSFGNLKVDDEVLFDFPGQKNLLKGVIKGFSNDKNKMVKLQNKLNVDTKPKRDGSFHEDAPRKAAVKCLERGFRSSSNQRQTANSSRSQEKKVAVRSKKSTIVVDTSPELKWDVLETSSASANVTGNLDVSDSDDGSADLTPEEMQLLQKLAAKSKLKDFQQLRNINARQRTDKNDQVAKDSAKQVASALKADTQLSPVVEPHGNKKVAPKSKESLITASSSQEPSVQRMHHKWNSDDELIEDSVSVKPVKNSSKRGQCQDSSDSSEPEKDSKNEKSGVRKRKKRARQSDDIVEIKFEGEHYNYKKGDPKATQLVDSYEVYVKKNVPTKAKLMQTPTSLARFLTREVFTEEARLACSVCGKPSLAKGTKIPEKRTRLDPDGIDAILAFVQARGNKKGWKNFNDTQIKQAMGNMLCDGRARGDD